MKVLHTTDLHFNKKWFEWIANQQENYDVFCITGDFLEDRKEESLAEQIVWVSSWMRSFKKPLLVCSGNHDIEDLDNETWLSKVSNVYSDNAIATIGGVKFGCVEYIAPDFDRVDDCDVVLYHLPPAHTKTSIHKNEKSDWGDLMLARLLTSGMLRPKALLCGHMHHPASTIATINNTTIYNPGVGKNSNIPNHHSLLF